MGLHDGHRARMRSKYIEYGGQSFNDHEIIEMLLYYAYPRKDMNETAHRVLNEFGGSVTRLVNSDPKTISDMCGISINAATLFSLIGEISRRMSIEKWDRNIVLDKTAVAGEYAVSYLNGINVEKLYVVCLNNSMSVIKCVEASSGNIDSVYIDIRKIVEIAVKSGASNIILMHNHPSGNIKPSYQDIRFTIDCRKALERLKIKLTDHIIVADGKYYSFKDDNVLSE